MPPEMMAPAWGTAEGKVQAFQAAGIAVARHPDEIAEIVARMV